MTEAPLSAVLTYRGKEITVPKTVSPSARSKKRTDRVKRRDSIKVMVAASVAVSLGPTLGGSAASAAGAASGPAAGRYQKRLERYGPAAGSWGRHPNVIAEYIEIPGYQEPHTPPEFNNIYFMRYRYDTGAPEPGPVKAIIITQMGGGAAGSSHSELAAQVTEAGMGDIEFWVTSRRQVGLEDKMGIKLALDSKNPAAAKDYYFGPSSSFVSLQDRDMPFMAYWGLEVAMRDIECILNLVPKERQATNVFIAGHSLGGYLSVNFASYQFPDGQAGFEKIAGIIVIDGGPTMNGSGQATVGTWRAAVQDLIDLRPPALGKYNNLGTPSALTSIDAMIQGMSGFWDPDGESPHRLTPRTGYRAETSAGGGAAAAFMAKLRLSNEALVGMQSDDDGIPGSMFNDSFRHGQSQRCGRLDFPRLTAPGVPPLSSIDDKKVYGWLSGGAGQPAGETDDGPFNCYPTNQQSWWFHGTPNPNPVRSDVVCLTRFFSGERTNIKGPIKYKFPVSGEREIFRGCSASRLWYSDTRPLLDTIQAGGVSAPEMNVTRKKDIDIPIIVYGGDMAAVPGLLPIFPQVKNMAEFAANTKVKDWTQISSKGVEYSGPARERSVLREGSNTRLYNHGDYSCADNSVGAERTPGSVGASVITNTLVSWTLARVSGRAPVPAPSVFGLD
jgi:pimeloyl-ACP methyl ester carboxylesterase